MMSDQAWREHCREAVNKFVMNAVVIDNEPSLEGKSKAQPATPQTATIFDGGLPLSEEEGDVESDENATEDLLVEEITVDTVVGSQSIDIKIVSDAFAEKSIACAFVIPDADENETVVIERAKGAALASDIVVVDWYLRGQDSTIAKKILTELAKADVAEKGRMRLVCIFSGLTNIEQITEDAIGALEAGGIEFTKRDLESGRAYGSHHSLVVLTKSNGAASKLPEKLLDAMTKDLADGLLPSFSLAAIAAIRRNMHHIITRFSGDLDGAYVANRLMTDTPTDAAELLTNLFVSECDTALRLSDISENYLGVDQIKKWLKSKKLPRKISITKGEGPSKETIVEITEDFVVAVLDKTLADGQVMYNRNKIKLNDSQKTKLSDSLHPNFEESKRGQRDFAKYVAMKLEPFNQGSFSKDGSWVPRLGLGTLLCLKEGEGPQVNKRYFYCLTPACDTLRLYNKVQTFVFLEIKNNKKKVNLVVTDEDGNDIKLFVDPKPTNVCSYEFLGDVTTGLVMGEKVDENDLYHFISSAPGNTFIWLGEVRRDRANMNMAELNSAWIRLGISDSEYLRLAGKGEAKL